MDEDFDLNQFALKLLVCQKCGHKWIPRQTKNPAACPSCKCRKWDRYKKEEQ